MPAVQPPQSVMVVAAQRGPREQNPIVVQPISTTTWEYDLVSTPDFPSRLSMNGHGEYGWELIQVIPRENGGHHFIYKRPTGKPAKQ